MSVPSGTHREEEIQLALSLWMRYAFPDALFLSDGSGVRLSKRTAVMMSKMRSTRGFPDMLIFEPRLGYVGLAIELKKEGTRLHKSNGEYATEHLKEQASVLAKLNARGWRAIFAVGFDAAKSEIEQYLK